MSHDISLSSLAPLASLQRLPSGVTESAEYSMHSPKCRPLHRQALIQHCFTRRFLLLQARALDRISTMTAAQPQLHGSHNQRHSSGRGHKKCTLSPLALLLLVLLVTFEGANASFASNVRAALETSSNGGSIRRQTLTTGVQQG